MAAEGPWGVRLLPDLSASGVVQMAIDDALLDEAHWVTARRYEWDPPALSLGKHQRWPGDELCRVAGETRREEADGTVVTFPVPVHAGRTIKRGTLSGILRKAGLSVAQLRSLI